MFLVKFQVIKNFHRRDNNFEEITFFIELDAIADEISICYRLHVFFHRR